jgi:hypothetical protein
MHIMTESEAHKIAELDSLLFPRLQARGVASTWASHKSPRSELALECQRLLADSDFRSRLCEYLEANPVIVQSIETALAHLAFSAGVKWEQAQPILHVLARRGQHLSRWLPTFLLVDGPLGRLLKQSRSPLAEILKSSHSSYPLLASARDAFNNDLFRKVRNGFAHWSFVWQDSGDSVKIQLFHFETGLMEAQVSLLEAEALHHLSVTVMQSLDQELLRKVRVNDG